MGFGRVIALKSRDFLPEVVQHGVRWRMSIVRPPMHLATCDDIDPRDFLFQNRGLSCAKLRVSEIARREIVPR